MLYDLFRRYKDIISEYSIRRFRVVGNSREMIIFISFVDNSSLYVRDYIFNEKEHKYSFHWQDKEGRLIMRWDNQPHWKKIRTFPHHRHSDKEVQESKEHSLEDVLGFIAKHIS